MLHCRIFGFLLDWRQSGLILLAFVAMPSPQTISSSLRCRRLLLFPNFRRESIFLVYPTESGRRRFLHRLRDDDDGRRVFFDQKKSVRGKRKTLFSTRTGAVATDPLLALPAAFHIWGWREKPVPVLFLASVASSLPLSSGNLKVEAGGGKRKGGLLASNIEAAAAAAAAAAAVQYPNCYLARCRLFPPPRCVLSLSAMALFLAQEKV